MPSTNRYRILIVDDDATFAELVRQMLCRDYDVRVAVDGQDAFRLALDFRPEVMILDMRMPRWNGLKTLQAFGSRPDLSHVRSIMLTADASRETVVRAIRAGVSDYIVKNSFTREDLMPKIRNVLPPADQRVPLKPRAMRREGDLRAFELDPADDAVLPAVDVHDLTSPLGELPVHATAGVGSGNAAGSATAVATGGSRAAPAAACVANSRTDTEHTRTETLAGNATDTRANTEDNADLNRVDVQSIMDDWD